jgi:hypothetical protein
MDPKLHEEIGRHLDAIASGVAWLTAVVYVLAATAIAWLLW